jgi:hypothetical protein
MDLELEAGMRVRRFVEGEQFLGTLMHPQEREGLKGWHIAVDGKPALFIQFFPEHVVREQWEVIDDL